MDEKWDINPYQNTFSAAFVPDETEWMLRKNLEECNKYMLKNKVGCDVTFMVGENTDIPMPCHKYMLASRSPVFFAMFYGTAAETSDVIKLPDVTSEGFRVMLECIYHDDVMINRKNCLEALYCAKKYYLPVMAEKCARYTIAVTDRDNVFEHYIHGRIYGTEGLVEFVKEYIIEHVWHIMRSPAFFDWPQEWLEHLLGFEKLALPELRIWMHVVTWASENCKKEGLLITGTNMRKMLGNAIYKIHFPTMTVREFADNVPRTKILTDAEKCSIYEFMHWRDKKKYSGECKFPLEPRTVPYPMVLRRFETFKTVQIKHMHRVEMTFRIDRMIAFKGVGISSSISSNALHTVRVTVMDGNRTVTDCRSEVDDDGTKEFIHCFITDMINLPTNYIYRMIITFFFINREGQARVRAGQERCETKEHGGCVFTFEEDDHGLIPEILFRVL